MLSKKCKYAIHALVYLAERHGQGPVQIGEIADRQKIPKKFLEAILLELRNGRILNSKKGKGGGYYLQRSPEEINLTEVIRLTNGPIALLPCVSLNFYESCEECVNEKNCTIRTTFLTIRDETLKILSESNLAALVKKQKKDRK
ncbi:MAG TPA: Rrf2 family transcriptional regulator [Cyclobacteriaceae bacterium]|nr:Rrf2 family transcriptional regulator [Cyclobacteriaceae bacterium]HMV10532.1 Rrf2 family transcriptional regulator [Cyclobacteriaceae bacterium]HMV89614.1 Rrf2 family transcriptional regulator [Cyclobacteriaceae bacterium]HMW99456.1 Rrf2 family transcriptional regulator [Cyclobacteriaceae bacterium]HMX48755.1 Rrf2 family transcriptional regulator [Cyclobacteriaceae bacterium]